MADLQPVELTLTGLSMFEVADLVEQYGGQATPNGFRWTYTLAGETTAEGVEKIRREMSSVLGREI